MRTPPEVTEPGSSRIRLVPRPLICSSTRACAPAPTASMVITAGTPLMMPSMVSVLRSLFTRRARRAMRMLATSVIEFPCSRGLLVELPQHRLRVGGLVHTLVVHDVPVAETDDARSKCGDIVLVRDQHHRHTAAVQLLQQPHQLETGSGV